MTMVMALSGCMLKRGVDFGYPVGAAERIPLIRISTAPGAEDPLVQDGAKILLLPVLGDVDKEVLEQLRYDVSEEVRKYFNAFVFEVSADGPLSEYITLENLSPTTDLFDQTELSRLGQLLGASHVLACKIKDARFYAPQYLRLYFTLVDVSSALSVMELEGNFDAREQQVQMALADYLQRRRGRKFDKTNFDVMMYSPAEYMQFVTTECCRAMADRLWARKEVLK